MGGDGAALPARQTWYPANHRRNVRILAVGSGLLAADLPVTEEHPDELLRWHREAAR